MSKKDAILVRSTQVFLETGLHKLSMDELAEKIGVSKKTIYNNFGSKEKLLEAIIQTSVSNLVVNSKEVLTDDNLSIVEKVDNVFKQIYTFHAAFETPLNKDPAANMIFHSPFCVDLDGQMNFAIYKLGVEAKEAGYIKPGINVEMFPYIFNNLIHSTSSWVRPDNVSFSRMDLMKQTLQLILNGILTPEAQKLFSIN